MSQSPDANPKPPMHLPDPRDPLWPRQFGPDDLACFSKRGGRLPQGEWLKLTFGNTAAAIAYYERATGIPFCRGDLDHLSRAMVLTSLPNVCRAITASAAWPAEHPGFFLIKQGFAVVTNLIDRNPRLLWSKRQAKYGVVSGYEPDINEMIRRRNMAPEGRSGS